MPQRERVAKGSMEAHVSVEEEVTHLVTAFDHTFPTKLFYEAENCHPISRSVFEKCVVITRTLHVIVIDIKQYRDTELQEYGRKCIWLFFRVHYIKEYRHQCGMSGKALVGGPSSAPLRRRSRIGIPNLRSPNSSTSIFLISSQYHINQITEGWPSWLWRQVKVSSTSVSWWGNPREFESRPFHFAVL
ncbi:uncharacterized protein CLUP02_12968 [Colletotrichum lupini]|uniref:Uncharacterized protein n=1 Tax=Colletotrichum lupini TaxID=145971 RepID=A0A9Q8T1F8_9PEZI|nr:uncharacterized protein CLUP02_12968 [Colletotrichum lupini]UQC87463.1 hypothetical protein CLUP02_12968 [Colletotrichum lupini]